VRGGACILLGLLSLVAPAWSAVITGTLILDVDSRPAIHVQVQLIDAARVVVDSTRTDNFGRFGLQSRSVEGESDLPQTTHLMRPYPNPFHPSVRLPYVLAALEPVSLTVFNMSGQPVRHLLTGLQLAGAGETTWDGLTDGGRRVAAGVYLVRLQTAHGSESRKVTLIDGGSAAPVAIKTDEPLDLRLRFSGHAIETSEQIISAAGDQGTYTISSRRLMYPMPAALPDYELVGVPAGPFPMGSNDYADEQPPRSVMLSSFLLGIREVTVSAYAGCVETGACAAPATGSPCNDLAAADRQDHPVNCISWYDAQAFCSWAGLSLPTEAQWEKAARGAEGHEYPWGSRRPGGAGDCDRAVMMRAGLGLGCGHDGTAPVGERPAGRSTYGIDDLAGNVWEWTADTYVPTAYESAPLTDPLVDESNQGSTRRSVRGNSWYYSDPNPDLRAANRFAFSALRWWPYVGVRCALAVTGHRESASPMGLEVIQQQTAAAEATTFWLDRNQIVANLEGDTQPVRPVPQDDDMALIPMGRFLMGSADGDQDERPLRTVYVDSFRLDRFEVTVDQFRQCVEMGKCRTPHYGGAAYRLAHEANYLNWEQPGRDAHPINGVSWYDAQDYCHWASKRLPTEAEWEWAARSADGRLYPWGDEQATCERAIIDEGGDGCGHEMAWPVGSRAAGVSPFGVYDLAGNLWEWTADWYSRDFYGRGEDVNPFNDTQTDGLKVLRGGSMADQNPRIHRSTNRLGYPPEQRYDYTVGFRCAATIQ
jgi:formylglycine-generating enzyme required for sulfatase activity